MINLCSDCVRKARKTQPSLSNLQSYVAYDCTGELFRGMPCDTGVREMWGGREGEIGWERGRG